MVIMRKRGRVSTQQLHSDNNQVETSKHKDRDGHIKSMLVANRRNRAPTKREQKKLKQAAKKRSKALHWGKTRGKDGDEFVKRVDEQTFLGLPKQIQTKMNSKKRAREQKDQQLKKNKKQRMEEEKLNPKNNQDLFSLSNKAVDNFDKDLSVDDIPSEDESDIDDDMAEGSATSTNFFGYDSDESDIIDDITPPDNDQDKKNKKVSKKNKNGRAGDDDEDMEDNAPVIIDDKFFKIMEDREMPDNRLIEDLERKLGFNKKKKKNKKTDEEDGLDGEGEGQNEGKESELQKYVREKREKKKLEKQQKGSSGSNKKTADDDDEEEEYSDDDADDQESDGDDDGESDDDNDGGVRFNDGLDDLLDNLDQDEGDDFAVFNSDMASDEEDDNDLLGDGTDDLEEFGAGFDDGVDDGDMIEDGLNDLSEFDKFDQENGDDDDDEEDSEDEDEDGNSESEPATTSSSTTTAGKYIPPHLRKQMAAASQDKDADNRESDPRYVELRKQIRQLLNKLALDNIELCTNQALTLYEKNSKNDFHKIISDTILDAVCDSVNLQSQFVLVYASFITAMHNIIGGDIGSSFLERLTKKFDSMRDDKQKSMNLLTMICHVYNLGLIYSGFIYDIIRMLCENFNELNVELVYKILQTCGFQLRSDDPSALKDIVELVNSGADGKKQGQRLKFLLEMMNEIKNNRKKKEHEEEFEKYRALRKAMKTMQKKHGKVGGENTLRIPYKDLANADAKGRWWVVGSAWVGRQANATTLEPLVPRSDSSSSSTLKYTDNLKAALQGISEKKMEKLQKLAKQQRMTTEMRRVIFCIIMSADDYQDAFHRLLKLGIKKNDREIARVLLHCCCQEKQFNQYYALLAKEIASVHRSNSLTFQYTFFENFKQLNTFPVRKVINLSYLLAYLIGHSTLSLTVLKVVDFENLVKQEVIFFRLVIMHLLMDYSQEQIMNQCLRLVKVAHCEALKESLQLFLLQFIKREFRRSFVYDLLTVRDVTKKDDKKWLQQNEKELKKKAKFMKKILAVDASDLLDEDEDDVRDRDE